MDKNLFYYYTKFNMTTHACHRFWNYIKEVEEVKKTWKAKEIKQLVTKKFANQIKRGLPVDKTGAMHLPIGYGLHAVVICDSGGYKIITFHKNEKNLNIEDFRKKEANSGKSNN